MANYNQVILIGKLTRAPELRYTPNGKAIAKLGLAINRVWTNEAGEKKEEATFVDIDVFGRTAENVGQYLSKGSNAFVSGRLKLDQWDDKSTGQKRSRLGVIAETVQFLDAKKAEETPQSEPDFSKTNARSLDVRVATSALPKEPLSAGEDEQIPF